MQRRILLVLATSLILLVVFGVHHLRSSLPGQPATSWSLFSSDPQPDTTDNENKAVLPFTGSEAQGLDSTSSVGESQSDLQPLDSLSPDSKLPNTFPETTSSFPSSEGSSSGNALPLDVNEADAGMTLETPNNHLKEEIYPFQEDLSLPSPTRDLSTLAKYHPHNLARTGRHPTYATYFASRNPSLKDPYFMSTMQVIHRALWSPTTASKHPFTVFVAPFIPDLHRNLFRGAGANVVELPLISWSPTNADIYARWKDLFSRLHMWNQTQFTRIAFLDGDAFPVQQSDAIFETAQPQQCVREKLDPADLAVADEICDYVFSAVPMLDDAEISMAVAVLAPNEAMHARLLRNMDQTDKFDNALVEQAYLSYQFERQGAFPVQHLPRMYNGYYPQPQERWDLKIVHEKLWIFDVWGDGLFEKGNEEMVAFYDSEVFVERRRGDGED